MVQGGVTSGLLNALVAQDLPGPGRVFLHTDWSFKAPVRPGDTISAEAEITEVRRDKPITRLRTTITNQNGVVVLDGSALVYTFELHRCLNPWSRGTDFERVRLSRAAAGPRLPCARQSHRRMVRRPRR